MSPADALAGWLHEGSGSLHDSSMNLCALAAPGMPAMA